MLDGKFEKQFFLRTALYFQRCSQKYSRTWSIPFGPLDGNISLNLIPPSYSCPFSMGFFKIAILLCANFIIFLGPPTQLAFYMLGSWLPPFLITTSITSFLVFLLLLLPGIYRYYQMWPGPYWFLASSVFPSNVIPRSASPEFKVVASVSFALTTRMRSILIKYLISWRGTKYIDCLVSWYNLSYVGFG